MLGVEEMETGEVLVFFNSLPDDKILALSKV